jgi:hypothetical protein
MRKIKFSLVGIGIGIVIGIGIGINVTLSLQKGNDLSDVSLANVEALTQTENG